MLVILLVSLGGYLMGMIFWPYALEDPIRNPITAFGVMASFPTTIRQIFEGEYIWSDHMPWYYLIKYMIITIPTLVWVGFVLALISLKGIMRSHRWIFILFLFISFAFPVFFVVYSDANLYGAWRHMMFVYLPLVILSGLGYHYLFQRFPSKITTAVITLVIFILAIHPLRFSFRNHPYQYLYFNEWAGGIRGAYGVYETDYYFHSMQEASIWLEEFIDEESDLQNPVVAANFPVQWNFRNSTNISDVKYIKYYERGNSDWDYAIFGNSYIHPFQLREKSWPPENTIFRIDVDGIPVCAVLSRESKSDLQGSLLLREKSIDQAIVLLKESMAQDPQNESVYINLAQAYLKRGIPDSSHLVLDKLESLYPDYDKALDLRGQLFMEDNQLELARKWFEKTLEINPKYYPASYRLACIYFEEGDDGLAVSYLKRCLRVNPDYEAALLKLGEYYLENGKVETGKKILERIK
jgi:tetratricopeptide (TPR) repeat protein